MLQRYAQTTHSCTCSFAAAGVFVTCGEQVLLLQTLQRQGAAPKTLRWRPSRALGQGNRLQVLSLHSAVPEARGLYDPANDKDACGVGFIGVRMLSFHAAATTNVLKHLSGLPHNPGLSKQDTEPHKSLGSLQRVKALPILTSHLMAAAADKSHSVHRRMHGQAT